jgi:hypothetical protein
MRIEIGSQKPEVRYGKSSGMIFLCSCILLFASLLPLSSARAAFSSKSAGTSGAAFLKIGAGARPAAMGEAFTSVADDVNSIYWNAAGLASLKEKNEFIAMRAQIFQDLEYNFFAFAHPTKSWGTFAIGLNNLNITGIEQRSADTDAPDSTFSSNDSAYTIAYAKKVSLSRISFLEEDEEGLQLGVGLKYVRQTIAGETANSVAADLGSIYRFSERPLSLGLAVQNLGSKSKFKSESDPLPLTIRLGSSYRLGKDWAASGVQSGEDIKTGLLLSGDVNFPRDNDPSLRLGTEFTHGWTENLGMSVRAGYQTGRSRQIEGTGSGVSAGAGIAYKFFSFDFAWMPYGNLGNTFRYSVKLRF